MVAGGEYAPLPEPRFTDAIGERVVLVVSADLGEGVFGAGDSEEPIKGFRDLCRGFPRDRRSEEGELFELFPSSVEVGDVVGINHGRLYACSTHIRARI